MSNVAGLDTSIQRTHEWLHDVERELGFDNERAAYAALRATLHALRDRLPVELVAHFGAGLPTFVRGIYYDGWHPSAARLKAAHTEDFAQAMRNDLHGHDELQNAAQVAEKVMRVLDRHMDPGQIEHIFDAWPRQVRELWRSALDGHGDR